MAELKKVKITMNDTAEFEGKIIRENSSFVMLRDNKEMDHKLFRANIKKMERILLEVPIEAPKKEVDENGKSN